MSGGVRNTFRWAKHEVRAHAGCSPFLFKAYNRLFDPADTRRMVAHPGLDLIMEGFGGSANSFAWWAFRSVNPEPHIGHHLHVPANVILAVRHKIPVVLIVRDPVGAVVSLYSRGYIPSLKQGLRHYIMFHERLLPYKDRVLRISFSDVTEDMGGVIHRCNEKFGTDFTPFVHTEENVKACRGRIRPSSQVTDKRREKKEAVLSRVETDPEIGKLCAKAKDLYNQFISAERQNGG